MIGTIGGERNKCGGRMAMATIKGQSILEHALHAREERRVKEEQAAALEAEQLAAAQHDRLVALLAELYGDDWAELEPQLGQFSDRVTIDEIRFSLRGNHKIVERVQHARLEATMMNTRTGERERMIVDTLADVGDLVARVKRI
jgi:hypothetical protein